MENDTYITYINGPWDNPIDLELWYNGPGWYFQDETGVLNGPFDTRYDAESTLELYAESLG